jgi:hypothetical protein
MTTIPSRASEFFKKIKESNDPVSFLQSLVSAKLGESEYVDYKGAAILDLKGNDLKDTWSKTLSGFANSDGGVVIWGIHAPNNLPQSIALAPNARDLEKRLLELQPNATEPPIIGVDVKHFPLPSSEAGFVVCFIPSSPWKPHQTQWPNKQYFIRSGDNCVPASHSIVKSLFHPSEVSIFSIYAQPFTESQYLQMKVWLGNAGPSTAHDVMLLYEVPKNVSNYTPDTFWRDTRSGFSGKAITATRPIHPTEIVQVFNPIVGTFSDGKQTLVRASLALSFRLFARNQGGLRCSLPICQADIDSKRMITSSFIADKP